MPNINRIERPRSLHRIPTHNTDGTNTTEVQSNMLRLLMVPYSSVRRLTTRAFPDAIVAASALASGALSRHRSPSMHAAGPNISYLTPSCASQDGEPYWPPLRCFLRPPLPPLLDPPPDYHYCWHGHPTTTIGIATLDACSSRRQASVSGGLTMGPTMLAPRLWV